MQLSIKNVPLRLVLTSQLAIRQSKLLIYKLLFQNTQCLFVLMPLIGVHTKKECSIIARNQSIMLCWLLVTMLTELGSLRILGELDGDKVVSFNWLLEIPVVSPKRLSLLQFEL